MKNEVLLNFPNFILQYLQRQDVVILDVRTVHEFVGGHVEGASNIPYDNLDQFLEEIQSWQKPVIVCSSGGRRSQIACKYLNEHGVEALDGGDWEKLYAYLKEKENLELT